ncbi:group 1 glycosyl transferase [Acidianus hospitalis]|uniref:Group 1 glycosyl transferase n=1 Tax=Acidianus hospitalis TaxID=563177 RepID=A0A2T9X4E4_9CREN|nr:group 1 glycosyl transferase [Acidianus hospitalis]
MRIIITRREHLDALDGISRFVFTLGEGMRKLGNEVFFLTHHVERDFSPLERWGADAKYNAFSVPKPIKKVVIDWFFEGSKVVNELSPDLVIMNGVTWIRSKAKKIAVIHGNGLDEAKKSKVKALALRFLYSRQDYVVCISQKVKRMASELGIKCHEVIPIPFKNEGFKSYPRDKREFILHVGTRGEKNVPVSVEAIRLLRERGFNVNLVIVGPAAHYWKEKFKYDWIIPKVVNDEELKELYARAIALILPSTFDGFSYTTLEASASGTPVVGSNCIPEEALIDGYNGFRINGINPKNYAEKLEIMLSNYELWEKISSNGKKLVEKYDYISISKKYLDLISD